MKTAQPDSTGPRSVPVSAGQHASAASASVQAAPDTAEQPSEAGQLPEIVVGVDGSKLSIIALRTARRLAGKLGCTVHALTVVEHPVAMAVPVAASELSPGAEAVGLLEECVEQVYGEPDPQGVRKTVVGGQAARVLVEASDQAEMLVVGNKGRSGISDLLLGSVSTAAASHARCPVLIVHGRRRVRH